MQTTGKVSRSRGCIIVCLMTALTSILAENHHLHADSNAEFNYNIKDKINGPLGWPGQCNKGKQQSPVDLQFNRAVQVSFTKIMFNQNYMKNQLEFYFANTGHTVQIQLNSNPSNPMSELEISGLGLQEKYRFAQMHFHWGDRDAVGSEHTIHKKQFPLEIHFVHYKSRYGTLSGALKSNDREAVMVLATMCTIGQENQALSTIIDAVKQVQKKSGLMRSKQPVNLHKILPPNLSFLRYLGSLTTPDCQEQVVWTVFTTPIQISRNQMAAIRKLQNSHGHEYFNYRPLQNLNGRKVTYYERLNYKDSQVEVSEGNRTLQNASDLFPEDIN